MVLYFPRTDESRNKLLFVLNCISIKLFTKGIEASISSKRRRGVIGRNLPRFKYAQHKTFSKALFMFMLSGGLLEICGSNNDIKINTRTCLSAYDFLNEQ